MNWRLLCLMDGVRSLLRVEWGAWLGWSCCVLLLLCFLDRPFLRWRCGGWGCGVVLVVILGYELWMLGGRRGDGEVLVRAAD